MSGGEFILALTGLLCAGFAVFELLEGMGAFDGGDE